MRFRIDVLKHNSTCVPCVTNNEKIPDPKVFSSLSVPVLISEKEERCGGSYRAWWQLLHRCFSESCVSLTVASPSLVAEAPTSKVVQKNKLTCTMAELSYGGCVLPASLFVNTNSTHKNRRRYSKRSIASSPTISSLSTSLAIDSNLYTIYEPYTTIIL